MSNEFDRCTTTFDTLRFVKFVTSVRRHARATDSVDSTGNTGWPLRAHLRYASIRRGSQAIGESARRWRDI